MNIFILKKKLKNYLFSSNISQDINQEKIENHKKILKLYKF